MLEEGRVQMVLPLVDRIPEREALYDFTFPYLSLQGTIVVRNDTPSIHFADLNGHDVAVLKGDKDLLALLNEGLALITADGNARHHYAKWFSSLELPANRHIIIGGDHNFPPYEFLDKNGEPTEFTVDLTRALAKAMDLDIEIRLGPWGRDAAATFPWKN